MPSRQESDPIVICAWCKKIMSEGSYPASHGICRDCFFDMHGVYPEDEEEEEEEPRKRNMAPTKRIPVTRLGKKELARKIVEALDESCAKLNRAKYYLTVFEEVTGDEIDDEAIVVSLLDLQGFAKFIDELYIDTP